MCVMRNWHLIYVKRVSAKENAVESREYKAKAA